MSAPSRVPPLAALALLGGCSISFDGYLRTPQDGAVALPDAGPTPDRVTPPTDLGGAVDTGPVVTDNGPVVTDNGPVVTDNGPVVTECRAPYLVAVAENLDNNDARLLRWSWASGGPCADLRLSIPHPRTVGVAFNNISDLSGPQLIVVNDSNVSAIDADTGATIRDVAAEGQPRSVFDLVANGQGSFAVAYTFAGGSSPGTVGTVRVFDHRNNNLVERQVWQRNMQYGLSVLWMTAYPGNQGQYTQIRPADTGSGSSAVAAFPGSSGLHTLTMPGFITNRQNVVAATFYRSADRRGRYALALSGGGSTPVVYVADSAVSSATQSNVFNPTQRCSDACPAITRAVASPVENGEAAAICELSGTQYAVRRFGGAATGCTLLDTSALGGRWRINDLAVVPR
ncbi:MAG: hypothetical protein U0325_06390 [Polyangiales bacterium]